MPIPTARGGAPRRAHHSEQSPVIDVPAGANTEEVFVAAEHWAVLFSNFLERNLGDGAADDIEESARGKYPWE